MLRKPEAAFEAAVELGAVERPERPEVAEVEPLGRHKSEAAG